MKNFKFLFILIFAGTVFSLISPQVFSQEQNTTRSPAQGSPAPPQSDEGQMNPQSTDSQEETSDEPLFDQQEASNYFKKGATFYRNRNYKNAIAEFEKAIEINPDYKEAYYLLGYAYYETGKMEPSRKAFEQAYELDHRYSPVLPR
ncbi:MAG: tetratricopeptide repeat protein [Nitrospiria bacterium]